MSSDGQFKFFRQARIVPSYRNGQPNGLKLYAIRPGSVFAALGLRNGDTISSVNNLDITDMESAMVSFKGLKKARRVRLEIIRRGKPVTLNYRIVKG